MLLGSVETNANFLTFPVSYTLESLCDLIWPVGPDDSHPLAGQYQSCSYGPGPVALGVSVPLQHEYVLGSLETRIRISDSSTPALTISCIDVTVSPFREHAWYWDFFLWLPAALAIAYFIAAAVSRTVTSITLRNLAFKHKARPGGEPNFWKDKLAPTVTDVLSGDSVINSPALLRFVTPGFADLLLYIQFVSVLGITAVRWPDYAYTYFRQTAWASLLGNVTLVQPSQADRLHVLSSNAFLPATTDGSPDFATQMTSNASSPLYLDTQTPNTFLNLNGSLNGMESYAHMLGLRAVDVFGTTTAIWLIMVGLVTVVSLAVWITDMVYSRHLRKRQRDEGYTFDLTEELEGAEKEGHHKLNQMLHKIFGSHVNAYVGNLLRLLMLFHLPLTITSVYHFSKFASSHPGTTACAALSFAFFCVIAPVVTLWRLTAHQRATLWSDKQLLLSYGSLYNYYDRNSRPFPIITFAHSLALGIVLGAGQESGSAQAIIFVVLEVLLALAYILWLPWGDGATMAPLTFIWSVVRIATSVLVLLLSPVVALSYQARGWITWAILFIQALMAAGFVLLLLVKIVEAIARLGWRVSFDDNKSSRNSGLSGAMHRIRRRKYKTRQLRKPSRTKRKSQTAPPRSRTPSMNLMRNKGTNTDYTSSPYAAYFASDAAGDEDGIMSALPPLRGVEAGNSAESQSGGFVRLGGGRATDEGTSYNAFTPKPVVPAQTRLKPRFGRGLWWRRVPAESENDSLSSSDDDEAYGLGTRDQPHNNPSPTPQGRKWGLSGALKRIGGSPTPRTEDSEEANELAPLPASESNPHAFLVVRPPRGTLSTFSATHGLPANTDVLVDHPATPEMIEAGLSSASAGPSTMQMGASANSDEAEGKQANQSTLMVRPTNTTESAEANSPASPHLKAEIRTRPQLYSLSESTHASSEPTAFWLPSDSPQAQAAHTPAAVIREPAHMPAATERETTAAASALHPVSAADMYSAPDGAAVEALSSSDPFNSSANNHSLLSVGASLHSRRLVEGQSAEILTLDD